MRVSVIAQCYNHERFVEACLDSIALQTYQHFELIIVDDASKDTSVSVIERWVRRHRASARVLALPRNRGVGGALNDAIKASSGEFVIRVSTDDVWEPHTLETLLTALDAGGADTGVAFANALCIDEQGVVLGDDFLSRHRPGYTPQSGDQLDDLAKVNYVAAPTVLMRRSALDCVGPFDESLSYEDWDMWLRLAEHFRFAYVPVCLARYRVVGNSLARQLFGDTAAPPSASLRVTHCRMAEKLLRMRRLGSEGRQQWREIHFTNAWALFCSSHPEGRALLCRGLRLYRRLRPIGVSAYACMGMQPRLVSTFAGLAIPE